MNQLLKLHIALTEPRPSPFGPVLEEPKFRQIYELVIAEQMTSDYPCYPRGSFNVFCPPSHPAVPRLLSLLLENGWKPYPGNVPRALWPTHYSLRILNQFDDSDLGQSSLLWVTYWGDWTTGETIAACAGRNGERWIGVAELEGEDFDWGRLNGPVDMYVNNFIHSKILTAFRAANLKGLRVHPLEWDQPSKAKGEFWELDPTFNMPPCLVPVVNKEGILNQGNLYDYQDGPFQPVQLRYSGEQVAAMGEFDLAWGAERLGRLDRPEFDHSFHRLIVSQRFRQVCLANGVKADYAPVLLDVPPPELPAVFKPFL